MLSARRAVVDDAFAGERDDRDVDNNEPQSGVVGFERGLPVAVGASGDMRLKILLTVVVSSDSINRDGHRGSRVGGELRGERNGASRKWNKSQRTKRQISLAALEQTHRFGGPRWREIPQLQSNEDLHRMWVNDTVARK